MPAIQAGRKCIKTRGRKAGQVVTVTKLLEGGFVEVQDEKGKTKRCNLSHLEPLS
jgi:large subunit ribosomal protein L14e